MKFTSRLLQLISLLCVSFAAHAEGGCPPGMIPYSGTDISSCGPIPPGYYQNSQQPQAPPMQWASTWGAIATDEPHGILGAAVGMPSKREAEQAALSDCRSKNGSDCKLELAYDNECAALVVSKTGYVVTAHQTKDLAIQSGMKTCRDSGYEDCHAYYSACSLPQQIQ
ncbi:DUF4189 domain-containing protein [Dyella dinghuensis]|uniref:DUF4189 domain-containing protein n=1 Tax=Dyella dinghuensis TaxID=1920169 RepID=A0A432LWV4_9GAMM|nr:DUF4189 domain-containing protein [Dyella dinghuensis]RUL66561.1 DUF4189 domain-containing protein [Dyella dinghuensis]